MDRLKPFYLPSLLAVVLFVSFFRLGAVSLFDVDEAVFSEATKEMVQSGDWLTPTYNGVNRYDKPILFYWLMAVSYKAFGIDEFAARFPSALAAGLLCLSLFFFLRKTSEQKTALNGALSFAVSVYFLVYSHAAVTDMALTLFISLSLFSFFLSLTEGISQEKRQLYLCGLYLFSSLAFLTKGLIGIIFPFGIAIIYQAASEKMRGMKRVFSLPGALLFLIVSLPWYVAEVNANGKEFIDQFFIKHHFKRYFDVISGHQGPAYYYIPVLIIGLLPWVAFLPAGIARVFTGEKSAPHGGPSAGRRLGLFAFIWFVFILSFFSFSTTKLPNYILPSIPAASVLIAAGMAEKGAGWRRLSNGIAAVLSLSAGIAFLLSKNYLLKAGIADTQWTFWAALILFGIAGLSFYGCLKKPLYHYVSGLMLVFLILLSVKALPIVNGYLQAPLYRFSIYAKERLRGDERIIAYNANNPSIVFYSGHKVIDAGGPDELASLLREGRGRIVIAKTKEPETLEKPDLLLIEKAGGYALLEKK